MHVLVIGGTRYVGRFIVEDLLRRGHEVTLFHRGETNPSLFQSVERVLGDRTVDVARLGDRTWDVVIDTCGYEPADVGPSVAHLVDRADRYVFISSAAVYEPTTTPGITERSPVQHGPPPLDGVEWWHSDYARDKVSCERLVVDVFGAKRSVVLRPGMIVGPHDPVWYFTYWVVRMLRGGEVLAPGDGRQPLQLIDVRDLASFTGSLVDDGTTGTFTVDGPATALTLGSCLEQVAAAVGRDARLVWVDDEWLLRQGLEPPWERLPYWLPTAEVEGYCRMDVSKAVDHGLTLRPLTETARDVRTWYEGEDFSDREGWAGGVPPARGITPELETQLLAACRK